MLLARVIPCLLLRGLGLVKTTKFRDPRYLGDPINIVRIFNDKEVDELVLLDITATSEDRGPAFEYLAKVTDECFMPLCYGGGVRTTADMATLFGLGIEKIAINTRAVEDPGFVEEAAGLFGSQSVIVSIDVKRNWLGHSEVYIRNGKKSTGLDPAEFAVAMEQRGAGELLLNSIDRDGTMRGYDLELVKRVSSSVSIPVIACGGASGLRDLGEAIRQGGASAVAAGSMFVFQGPHKAVLISYPSRLEIEALLDAPAQ